EGAVGECTTTDNSFHTAYQFTLSNWALNTQSGSAIGHIIVTARNAANGDKAYWDQPVLMDLEPSNGSTLHGSLLSTTIAQKDLALALTAIDIDVSGGALIVRVKGINGATIRWAVFAKFDVEFETP